MNSSYNAVLLLSSFLSIIVSGIFSLFDSSLRLCRKSRLEKSNSKKYKAVSDIHENPRNILSACRLWINILWILASFFSGVFTVFLYLRITSYNNFNTVLLIFIAVYALVMGITITFFGDALPKFISGIKPEAIAAALLPAMKAFCFLMMPFVLPAFKLESVINAAFRRKTDDTNITEEELQDELRHTLIEGEKSGIVKNKERSMVEGVFYLSDRPVGAFMTHRSEILWLDINMPYEEIREKALEYRAQSCYPVVDGSPDEIIGAVYLEDLIIDSLGLKSQGQKKPQGLRAIMKKAQFVPETMTALKAFESFKHGQVNFLFVMDEYGGLAGIISIRALVEEIVGELSAPSVSEEPLTKLEDGSYLADGTLNIDDAAKALSLTGLPEEDEFHTLAGFILHLAGELPGIGDSYEYQGYKFKVVDKDSNRIDKLLITKISNDASSAPVTN